MALWRVVDGVSEYENAPTRSGLNLGDVLSDAVDSFLKSPLPERLPLAPLQLHRGRLGDGDARLLGETNGIDGVSARAERPNDLRSLELLHLRIDPLLRGDAVERASDRFGRPLVVEDGICEERERDAPPSGKQGAPRFVRSGAGGSSARRRRPRRRLPGGRERTEDRSDG